MTVGDDDLDDLVRGFRADDGHLDEATRARLTAGVQALIDAHGAAPANAVASAPMPTDDAPAPTAAEGAPARAARWRPTWILAAAAVLLVAVLGGVALRGGLGGGPTEEARTAPADAPTSAPTLDELAERAAGLDAPVLGDPGATYSHHVADRHIDGGGDVEPTVGRVEVWVDRDGRGRSAEVGAPSDEGLQTEVRALGLGGMYADEALALPDDAAAVLAVFDAADPGSIDEPEDHASAIANTLAVAGLPARARAGLLRALAVLGFAPTGPIDATTGTARYEGPGVAGSALVVTIDPETTTVVSVQETFPDGRTSSTAYSDVGVRPDTSG